MEASLRHKIPDLEATILVKQKPQRGEQNRISLKWEAASHGASCMSHNLDEHITKDF